MRAEPTKVLKLIGFVSLVVGIGAFGWGTVLAISAIGSANWPTAPGRIITSKAVTENSADSSDTMYHADIRYSYIVEGVTYTGNRVRFGEFSTNDRDYVWRTVKRYPVAKEVSVHYNPQEAGKSVLETGINWMVYSLLGGGLAFGTAGVLLQFILPRRIEHILKSKRA